ncbi:uncharacterized protein BDZ99DRAFT_434357 [Mytilinidion resinicola]|uniref:Secreted protein n=1 Tax=Mytilinidion resinicola TaxID=574789 RepID=A0A6A6Z0T2_9PEZI|nr:uncharacterized protein BDZ99DRAFT_434357 [Mytilinidion resinicola]KAF2814630.1 hypothetical protein BDZ99DRAFT_434357 [Mytilinidion resinicola]
MRSSSLVTLVPLAATMVSAGCFGGGAKGDHALALAQVDSVCAGFQGSFEKKQPRNACVFQAGENTSWYFSIRRDASEGGILTKSVCIAGLTKEVTGCDHGGQSKSGDWIFTSDPNDGMCSDTEYINNQTPQPPPSKERRSNAPPHQHANDFSVGKRQPEKGDIKIVYDIGIPVPNPVSEKRSDVTIVYDVDIPEKSHAIPFQA